MGRLASFASALAALLLLDAAPGSEISICNDFKVRIYVALAFEDQGNFTAAGWWTIDPNKCEPAVFSFPGSWLYYTADSDKYPASGGGTSQDHWGNETNLFVGSKKFNFDHAERSRPETSGEMFGSVRLSEVQPTKPVSITFHFLPGNSSVTIGQLPPTSTGGAATPAAPSPSAAATAVPQPNSTAPATTSEAAHPLESAAQARQQFDMCVNKGNAFSTDQQMDACTAAIQSGRWSGPGLSWAYNDRGNAHTFNAEYDQAIADYNQSIQLDPKHALAYNGRGYVYSVKKDYDRAIADFTKAIDLDPRIALAYNNRGNAYRNTDDYDRAMADFTEAIQIDPNFARAYNNRGSVYAAKNDYDRAIADYNKAIQLDPKFALAYSNRGLANLYAGALPKALADFDQASELTPKDGFTALWLDIASKRSNLPSRLAAATTQIDMTKWPAPIIRLYLSQLTPEAVFAAADDPDPILRREKVCAVSFFIGELALQEGKKDDAARLFRAALTGCPRGFVEVRAAGAELEALGQGR